MRSPRELYQLERPNSTVARWPEEGFSSRRHACRLCARNKIRRSPRPSAGQSSLQNSNLITPAFESGTKDKGEYERERAREEEGDGAERIFIRGADDRITDST